MNNSVIVGSVLLIILYFVILYNKIIRKRNQTENAFGSIDAMLKKRFDLIPNLVESVKKYMDYESGVLVEITRLRSGYDDGLDEDKKVKIHNEVSKKLGEIMVQVENYPNLKANESFLQLQRALNENEEQISASRRFYNSAITDYNNSIQTFPANLVARIFNFHGKDVFLIEEVERKNIDVKELF